MLRFKKYILAGMVALTVVLTIGCGNDPKTQENSEAAEPSGTESGSEAAEAERAENAGSTDENQVSTSETTYPLTITDDLGNEIVIEAEPERVVSLSPANTEILFAIGADACLQGRTDYCDYPEEAAAVESIGTYASPNMELIISKSPDVVFASDYIDDAIRSQIESTGAAVVIYTGNSVESVKKNILLSGQILNRNSEAREVTDEMTAQMEELQSVLAHNTEQKSAFIDIGSFYSAGEGSLLDNMLKDLGIINIAAESGEEWPQLSVEKIIESNPDLYISLYPTPEELGQISGLAELDCIKNGSIIFYDGLSPEASMIQRAGPRLVEGTRLLAEQVYPELF